MFRFVNQMHETKYLTTPALVEETEVPEQTETAMASETQKLTEEGVVETKGERSYPE